MISLHRLHLASLDVGGQRWPVHGFVVIHPGGAMLVDTGVGGPQEWLDDWRVVNTSVADALATLDMTPADISMVVNTHLHFDHCGQNAVFPHAAFYVQRDEVARCERESQEMWDWFGFMNARWELLDGDTQLVPGVSVVATPGHTSGHQCVVVSSDTGADVLIGDAAYTPVIYTGEQAGESVPGQAADVPSWNASLTRLRSLSPERVHFCHHEGVVTGA